jgi:hypothetical protein
MSAPLSVSLFYQLLYGITFSEFGLSTGTPWTVTLDNNVTESSNSSSIMFEGAPGLHNFVVSSPLVPKSKNASPFSVFTTEQKGGSAILPLTQRVTVVFASAVPAVVYATQSNVTYSIINENITLTVGRPQLNNIRVDIQGSVLAPTLLVFSLAQNALPGLSESTLSVTLDGVRLQPSDSVFTMMNLAVGHNATYLVTPATSGYELVVAIPHLSKHTVELATVVVQPYFYVYLLFVVGIVTALAALFLALLLAYRRRGRKTWASYAFRRRNRMTRVLTSHLTGAQDTSKTKGRNA